MKRLICLLYSILLIVALLVPINVSAAEGAPIRQINVVYDDSGSMYKTNGNLVDTWCQAKYSMEVFAAMLGETDKLNIYYMSDYRNGTQSGPRIVLNGIDGAASNVGKIHRQTTKAGNTPFDSVRKAYSDLQNSSADEKWLVILTDGDFQGVDGKAGIDAYLAQKASDINVMFLGMGPEAAGITAKEGNNIFYVEAKTNNQILTRITGICTRIFNSNRLDVNVSSKNFSFDVPMGSLIVFAQGANVQINGIQRENGSLIKSSKTPVEVKYSDCDATNYSNQPATDLVGSIATFIDDFSVGNYTVDVSGAETIEIYYKPNVEVAAYLADANGNEVTDMANLEAGEYTLSFGFVKAGTREKVNQSSLLGEVQYEAYVTNNDVQHENAYTNGDKITLEEGTLSIDVTARYLDYNSVATRLDYSIYKDKEITFTILKDPAYEIISEGISSKDYIEVEVKIDGHELTPEQWEIMDTPSIKLADASRDFKINEPIIEKTGEVGMLRIYPSLPNGKPSTGTYVDCDYTVSYQQKFGSETWSGGTKGTIKLNDKRSWWERNWDLFVKLLILLAIIFVLAGYLPFIKHYLPKSLKKKPYIKCIPSEPGEKRKDRNGIVDKSLASTIIPYIPQTGTIKYVPKGVPGAPPLSVRAIKRRRMTLTNVKAFAGKEYITFDGEAIKKDCKKFDTGAAVTIRVKHRGWTYVCNPNQSNN